MDNKLQIEEIRKYRHYLSQLLGYDIDEDTAAGIWIRKYAETWRLTHSHPSKFIAENYSVSV
jgi:hypothetical protein